MILIINLEKNRNNLAYVYPLQINLRKLCSCNFFITNYQDISLDKVNELNPKAIFIVGQSIPWNQYTPEELIRTEDVILYSPASIFGINGGMHIIAMAYNCKVDLIKGKGTPQTYEGFFYNHGPLPI